MQALTASAGSYVSAEAQAVSTLGSIFAAPAITPVPATGNPTFTGALSLLTRIEEAVLLPPIKAFFDYLLQQEAVTQEAPISFVLANGETHDWILLTSDGLHYWPQIYQELGA